jgi:hypothetical protein
MLSTISFHLLESRFRFWGGFLFEVADLAGFGHSRGDPELWENPAVQYNPPDYPTDDE